MSAIEIGPSHSSDAFIEWNDFSLAAVAAGERPTRYLHIAFVAGSREVNQFWQAGIDAGYEDDGPPGERLQYSSTYYGGFLVDPAGNSVEAVHHEDVRRGGHIDHLWIGVSDLRASVAFYNTIALTPGSGPDAAGRKGDSSCAAPGRRSH